MNDTTARTGDALPRRTVHDKEALVRELYVDKRLSDREIAEGLGVNRVTITRWRRVWRITREDRVRPEDLVA